MLRVVITMSCRIVYGWNDRRKTRADFYFYFCKRKMWRNFVITLFFSLSHFFDIRWKYLSRYNIVESQADVLLFFYFHFTKPYTLFFNYPAVTSQVTQERHKQVKIKTSKGKWNLCAQKNPSIVLQLLFDFLFLLRHHLHEMNLISYFST